mmetsp:Transcript_3944/g.8386  ORF Transcript_3944/g.8386 Transcript_3944/m.8386 type:complete len:368 (-) Transcript_3944:83-1186(-)
MDHGGETQLSVALLGAGLFATHAHAPVLLRLRDVFDTKAVWSRRREPAEELAKKLGCDAFFGESDLDALIDRSDIDAFMVALPLDVQPKLVPRLLRAGKHVLSEKPIAPTVDAARQLLREYDAVRKQQHPSPPVWSIAENFRYETGIRRAASLVRSGEVGDVVAVSLTVKNPFPSDNPYVSAAWRSDPSWYGGFFVDAFVHAAAGLRCIIPGDIRQVSAVTSHRADHLPPPDTLVGHVTWTDGIVGSVTASYACNTFRYEFEIIGRKGTVLLRRTGSYSCKQNLRAARPGYNLVVARGSGRSATIKEEFLPFDGLDNEFMAFAAACGRGNGKWGRHENTPQEALRDLELVEALLDSGRQNGAIINMM